MQNLLVDWTSEHTKNFFAVPMKAKHRAEETGLFTDEALASLIDIHPVALRDICTMGDDDPDKPNAFRSGDARHLTGKELLQAVKDGQIWINLRKVTEEHDDYKTLVDAMLHQVKDKVPGFDCKRTKGGLLISSQNTRVPYHADQTTVMLWHVRGIKRLYVYPRDTEFMSEEHYESIILQETTEDVPYRPHFEDKVTELRLEPGEMAFWPLNAPHKVENETFCVSVTMDCPTRQSAVKNSIFYANGILRRKLGMNPAYATARAPERFFKMALGALLRKAKVTTVQKNDDFVSFKVDPHAPRCIVDIEPELRAF